MCFRNEDIAGILNKANQLLIKSTVYTVTVTRVKAEKVCPRVPGLPASTHRGPVFGGREAGLLHAAARHPPDLE